MTGIVYEKLPDLTGNYLPDAVTDNAGFNNILGGRLVAGMQIIQSDTRWFHLNAVIEPVFTPRPVGLDDIAILIKNGDMGRNGIQGKLVYV
jgi:hypothetical protein